MSSCNFINPYKINLAYSFSEQDARPSSSVPDSADLPSVETTSIHIPPQANFRISFIHGIMICYLSEHNVEQDYYDLISFLSSFDQSLNDRIIRVEITPSAKISFEFLNETLQKLGKNLHTLNLFDLDFSDEEVSILLSNCENLSHFYIDNNQAVKGDFLKSLFKFENLTHLDLRNCSAIQTLDFSVNLPKLESLNITNCNSFQSFTFSTDLPNLKILEISGCKTIETLTLIDCLKGLETLYISNCEAFQALTLNGNLFLLKTLCISSCKTFQSFTILETLPSLQALHLDNCEALPALILSENLPSLNRIFIISCLNLQIITLSEKLSSLTDIRIDGCSNLEMLTVSEELNELESLFIFNSRVLHTLILPKTLPKLNTLCINNCVAIHFSDALCQTMIKFYEKVTNVYEIQRGIELFIKELGVEHSYTQQLWRHITLNSQLFIDPKNLKRIHPIAFESVLKSLEHYAKRLTGSSLDLHLPDVNN